MKQNLKLPCINNCVHIIYIILGIISNLGFPGGSVGKESTCNARDALQFPSLGQEDPGYSSQGHKESDDWSNWVCMLRDDLKYWQIS